MGFFSRKDWFVIAVMFERRDLYRINGNRAKGAEADKVRDGAKLHERTLVWAVFDHKGAVLETEIGRASEQIPREILQRLTRELPRLKTVREILSLLESGKTDKAAKGLVWDGYPEKPEQ